MRHREAGGGSPDTEGTFAEVLSVAGERYKGLVETTRNNPAARLLLGIVLLGSVEACGHSIHVDGKGVVHGKFGGTDIALTAEPRLKGKGGGSVSIAFTPNAPVLGGAGEKIVSNE